jgi:hypothetical protein
MTVTNSGRFEDRLLEELRRVVAERPASFPGRIARRSPSSVGVGRRIAGARPPRLIAIGVACLAFGGTAMAATGVWDPGIGSSSPSGPPTVSETAVPDAMTEALGVLRRPPSVQDRSPEVEATLHGATLVEGVRPDSARYLAPGIDGEATVLISAAQTSPFFTEEEPICVFRPYKGFDQPLSICFGVAQLLTGQARSMASIAGAGSALAFGLVPDGVATVTAKFGSAPDRTVPVASNYFELELSGSELSNANGEAGIERTVWHDAEGAIVPQR